jgi:hypothetical protein
MPRSGTRRSALPLALGCAVLLLTGCQSAYFSAMEKIGYHKRDILVSRVEAARDTQEETREQFVSALEQFSRVVEFDGGKLESEYRRLNTEFERSEDMAEAVGDRIDAVEGVAEALFSEWRGELDQYTDRGLRAASEQQLKATRARYTPMRTAMRRAERSMQPVLDAFRDRVLFLKHNLNARAVAALKGELATVERDVAGLVTQMQRSIDESNAFIRELGTL